MQGSRAVPGLLLLTSYRLVFCRYTENPTGPSAAVMALQEKPLDADVRPPPGVNGGLVRTSMKRRLGKHVAHSHSSHRTSLCQDNGNDGEENVDDDEAGLPLRGSGRDFNGGGTRCCVLFTFTPDCVPEAVAEEGTFVTVLGVFDDGWAEVSCFSRARSAQDGGDGGANTELVACEDERGERGIRGIVPCTFIDLSASATRRSAAAPASIARFCRRVAVRI